MVCGLPCVTIGWKLTEKFALINAPVNRRLGWVVFKYFCCEVWGKNLFLLSAWVSFYKARLDRNLAVFCLYSWLRTSVSNSCWLRVRTDGRTEALRIDTYLGWAILDCFRFQVWIKQTWCLPMASTQQSLPCFQQKHSIDSILELIFS